MKNIGIALFLIGCGGLAEAYGNPRQTIISSIMALLGILLLINEVTHEEVHNNRRDYSGNILDRLHFLRP